MRFGMLGFAHVHAPGYAACVGRLPGSNLVAIADLDPNRLREAVARFGGDCYADPTEMLARDDIDAVILMAETVHHRDLAIAAAAAGKHLLCEKPIATTHQDGLDMIRACREHGVAFQTIFPVRYSQPAIALRQLIRSGEIGTPLAIKATNPGRMPPGWLTDPVLAGGGAVMDHTVHVADLLRWIFEREIVEVYAEVDTRLHAGLPVDDVGVMMLRLEGGLTASLDASWSRPKTWPIWGGLTIEVIGDRGVIAMDAFNENVRLIEDRGPTHALIGWGEDANLSLLAAFVDAVRAGVDPPITGEDGLRALDVVLAAYESARTGIPVACVTTANI